MNFTGTSGFITSAKVMVDGWLDGWTLVSSWGELKWLEAVAESAAVEDYC